MVVRRLSLISLAVMAVTFVSVCLYPALDTEVTRLFFVEGYGFPLAQINEVNQLQNSIRSIAIYIGVGLLLAFAASFVRVPVTAWFVRHRREFVYFLLVLVIGPGLLINVVFKDHWGRPRPSHTTEFLGEYEYVPPLIMSDACSHNCSFPAGDPAVGFFLVVFALVSARRARRYLLLAVVVGSAIGVLRIAMGGHYLSDVIFSGGITFLTAKVLHTLIYEKLWRVQTDDAAGRDADQDTITAPTRIT